MNLLTQKEKNLSFNEQEKLIEIRKKDEELKKKNIIEAVERKKRVQERLKRKRSDEEREIELACNISKEEEKYMDWITENVDLSVFKDNPYLHHFCLNINKIYERYNSKI